MNPEEIFISMLGDDYDTIKVRTCYSNAVSAINTYVNKKDINIEEEYPFVLIHLAYYYYKNFNDINIESKSQGGRSNTLLHDIPKEIKAMLPRYVKTF